MREINCYEAYDGKRFDDKESCIKYDYSLCKKDLIFLDKDFKALEWSKWKSALYVVVKSREALELHEEMYHVLNYFDVVDVGTYIWDILDGYFVPTEEATTNEILDNIAKLKERF